MSSSQTGAEGASKKPRLVHNLLTQDALELIKTDAIKLKAFLVTIEGAIDKARSAQNIDECCKLANLKGQAMIYLKNADVASPRFRY